IFPERRACAGHLCCSWVPMTRKHSAITPGAVRKPKPRKSSRSARDNADAGELLLRFDERGDVLVAEAEQIRSDKTLVNGLAHDRRHWQGLGEVRVIAHVLHGIHQRELEPGKI